MTPYRGIGANVAIKDAARLKRALVASRLGERALDDAIHDYETGMLDYGFRAVRNSLKAMHQTVTDSLPSLMISRLTLRAINMLPPVKQIVARRLGGGVRFSRTIAAAPALLVRRRSPWHAAPPDER
jgi:2-polyprenyl-6-methoxyphenol hydroxylase-like FAD-dependent oxidoreductase